MSNITRTTLSIGLSYAAVAAKATEAESVSVQSFYVYVAVEASIVVAVQ